MNILLASFLGIDNPKYWLLAVTALCLVPCLMGGVMIITIGMDDVLKKWRQKAAISSQSPRNRAQSGTIKQRTSGEQLRQDAERAWLEARMRETTKVYDDFRTQLAQKTEKEDVLYKRAEYRLAQIWENSVNFVTLDEQQRYRTVQRWYSDARFGLSRILSDFKNRRNAQAAASAEPANEPPLASASFAAGEMKVLFNGIFVTPEQYQLLSVSRAKDLSGKELLECLELLAEKLPQFADFAKAAKGKGEGWQFGKQSSATAVLDSYCQLLGLMPQALSPDSLKQAYRRAVMGCHPDKDKSAAAAARFQQVQEAYAALQRELNRKAAS